MTRYTCISLTGVKRPACLTTSVQCLLWYCVSTGSHQQSLACPARPGSGGQCACSLNDQRCSSSPSDVVCLGVNCILCAPAGTS